MFRLWRHREDSKIQTTINENINIMTWLPCSYPIIYLLGYLLTGDNNVDDSNAATMMTITTYSRVQFIWRVRLAFYCYLLAILYKIRELIHLRWRRHLRRRHPLRHHPWRRHLRLFLSRAIHSTDSSHRTTCNYNVLFLFQISTRSFSPINLHKKQELYVIEKRYNLIQIIMHYTWIELYCMRWMFLGLFVCL